MPAASRKVILAMQTSLDGFVGTTDGDLEWMFAGMDARLHASILATLDRISTHVMGRNTYLAQAATWPASDDPIAAHVNTAEKVVFSTTLTSLDWQHSRLAHADLADELQDLRQQGGGDIAITGGAQLARSAVGSDLVDEYQIVVHPVLLGTGLRMFPDGGGPRRLALVESERFDTGVLRTVYRRDRPDGPR